MNKKEKIKNIEDHLNNLKDCIGKDFVNLPDYKDKNDDYLNQKQKIEYADYMRIGDCDYLSSRILFKMGIYEHSFFWAQQCIENYLKGFLKFKKKNVKDTHDLFFLLKECRKFDTKNDFIKSEIIEVIVRKFIIFNETGRYCVVKKFKSQKGQYCIFIPGDIEILDYFVFKMKEIMPFPEKMADLFKFQGQYYNLKKETKDLFKSGNINFEQDFIF